MSDVDHGKRGYYHQACRCELCMQAMREYTAARRAAGTAPKKLHGTAGGYSNYNCRCDLCTKAWLLKTRRGVTA